MRGTKFGTSRTLNKPIQWLLRDEFSDTRAAGSVNGTMPTPGPGGARTEAGAGSGRYSVSGGQLSLVSGTAADTIAYDAIVRNPGVAFFVKLISSSANPVQMGFASAKNAAEVLSAGWQTTPSQWRIRSNASYTNLQAIISGDVVSAFLRAAGAFFFINNILIMIDPTTATSPIYPEISDASLATSAATFEFFRIAQTNWLPSPLISDGFGSSFGTSDGLGHAETSGIGSGGSNVTWIGSTWSVSGGKAINTPGVGNELIVNGGFDTDTNWTKNTGWTISGGVGVKSAGASTVVIYQTTGSNGTWYLYSLDVVSTNGGNLFFWWMGASSGNAITTTGTKFTTVRGTGSSTVGASGAAALSGTIDNVSLKPLALADLFASCLLSTADVFAAVDLVITAGTQAGLVLNLDSTSSPANFVIAYHDGTNAKLEKCVAGTYTSVISAAATYSSGARLVVSKIGTAYQLYYNNALVGSGTISDSGIVNNTRHGLFSTYASNTMDNFTVYASGSGGEYNLLNRYVNL